MARRGAQRRGNAIAYVAAHPPPSAGAAAPAHATLVSARGPAPARRDYSAAAVAQWRGLGRWRRPATTLSTGGARGGG